LNERIKEVRKSLGLTLEKFGKSLGVTKVAISNIENGNRGVTEQMFLSVCRVYNVNEDWLRNGTGEMFNKPSDEVGYYAEFLLEQDNMDSGLRLLIIDMIKAYVDLDDISKEVFMRYVNNLKDNIIARQSQKKET
jgi:transcriptional regulator with XRE-family HTH domain